MTEEASALEDVNDTAQLDENQEAEQTEEVDASSENMEDDVDYEGFAKVQGWSGKEKWRGDPDKWVDAKTFVERGREFQSTLKEKANNLERKLKEQEDANERTLKMFDKLNKKAEKEAFDKIRDQQKQALEDDNDSLYDELEAKKTKVADEYKAEEPKAPQQDPSIANFKAENEWYNDDPVMRDYADKYCQQMADKGYSITKQLEETKRYIVGHFPNKFENPRRQMAQTVSTGSAPSNVKKSKGWKDIPAADQKMGEGVMKSMGMTKADYVKSYFEMENL